MRWSVVFVIVRLICHGPCQQALTSRLWRDVLGEEFVAGLECRGLRHGIAEVVVAVCAQATPARHPRLVFVLEVPDCARRQAEDCRHHALSIERAVDDGAGESGARLRLDAALEGAEDGQVAGLQVGRTVRRMLAMHQRRIHACPCLPWFITSSRAVVNCRSVVVLAQPFSDVT